MSPHSLTPDLSRLDIPMDVWSQPYWEAAALGKFLLPRCAACKRFRWPAGPFCPDCASQQVEWAAPGQGRIYSFTILPVRGAEGAPAQLRIPALVEFDGAPGVRLVSALIDAAAGEVAIGGAVEIDFLAAANASVPVFRLAAPDQFIKITESLSKRLLRNAVRAIASRRETFNSQAGDPYAG